MKSNSIPTTPLHPATRSLAWLLLALTICLFSFAGHARAQSAAPAKPAMPPLFLEDTSPKPMVPTIEAFRSAVSAAGWSVLGVTNMTGILAERGFAVRPVLVFDVCSSRYSGELLSDDATLFVSSMMPCSVAIYQTSAGKVVISRMNSAAMGGMIGGRAGDVVSKSGQEMEEIIKATLKLLSK
jgi:uncharacterized protein (DUF302 family)